MQKINKLINPYYLKDGKKVSDKGYSTMMELPFTSCKTLHQLISDRDKFAKLSKVIKRLGLSLAKAGV